MILYDKTPVPEKKYSIECNAQELQMLRVAIRHIYSKFLGETGTYCGYSAKSFGNLCQDLAAAV